jgi:lactoylglutathione lyase
MISFSHMIFYVKDIPAALAFYEKAFGIKTKYIHESSQYAELSTGSTSIAFASEALGAMNLPKGYTRNNPEALPLACEITFTSADVQATYDHAINSGALAVAEPQQKPWGQTVAYVRDPNGVLIELASQMQ